MPFKLRYTFNIDFVGAGAGPMEVLSPSAGQMLPGGGSTGQTQGFVTNPNAIPVALGASGTFPANTLTSGDVTNLTNAAAADMAAQINAALAHINTFPSGGP
ncbi:MAG TPA: hypothetical protein VF748_15030 [Candidatus Acidoferrum sp.]